MNLSVYLLFLFNLKLLTTSQFCGTAGKIDYCCDNYYFDSLKKDCLECPNGSYGRNCSKTCIIPKYGWLCYETCECEDDEYCDIVSGCLNASTTSTQTSTPLVETSSVLERKESSTLADTTYKMEVTTYKTVVTENTQSTRLTLNEKDTLNVESVIIGAVSIASIAVIASVVGFIIFCCILKRKLSYPFQNPYHDASSNLPGSQVHVPPSNQEPEIYLEIEEISHTLGGEMIDDKSKEHVEANYDQLSKSVSDSSRYSEIGKYDKEKYKIFTTHKALHHHVELKRHYSWHNMMEQPLNRKPPTFLRKANSYLELCDINDYLNAVHKLESIEACREFIYANMPLSKFSHPLSEVYLEDAVYYDDVLSIIK